MEKKVISSIYLKKGQSADNGQNPVEIAVEFDHQGADEILIVDLSDTATEQELSLAAIKKIARAVDIPLLGCGNIDRAEDVKKLLYAGCRKVFLNIQKESSQAILAEVSRRFDPEKIGVTLDQIGVLKQHKQLIEQYASEVVVFPSTVSLDTYLENTSLPVIPVVRNRKPEELLTILKKKQISGITGSYSSDAQKDLMAFKQLAKEMGVPMNTYESTLSWKDFKLNSDGMVTVVVQDYKTLEVLMVAYMNEEAYETTCKTGRMTYWSRSRNELWMKGLTSGHFQYVKELRNDCDNDTILAKVSQVGAACHTGNRSCFYQTMMKKEYNDTNPMTVFQDVYEVIENRKKQPKEGSYTNYLFEKGLDKILKKVGEECAELIIAAKNPDPEEIKYELSDFLYHAMVLMVEKGVTWEDITKELAQR